MSVKLELRDEFKKVLEDYRLSVEARQLLGSTPLVIMLGVSGSGRNTVINHLVNSGEYHFIVSDTTRPAKFRDGKMERDGINYFFREEKEMLEELRQGKYLEAELIHDQQVSGISIRELERAKISGQIPITEVDLGGAAAIKRAKDDAFIFFLVPPSFKEWMYRLKGREVMSEQELRNRITTAKRVFEEGFENPDYVFVVNDSSHHSARDIDHHVRREVDLAASRESREIARKVYDELLAELALA